MKGHTERPQGEHKRLSGETCWRIRLEWGWEANVLLLLVHVVVSSTLSALIMGGMKLSINQVVI